MDTTFIYGLHSGDFKIRYIGKANDPEMRLKRHIRQYNIGNTHKNNWIKKCISENKIINYVIIEEVNINNWQEREKFWISEFRDLTNTSSGGIGGSGKIYTISYEDCKKWVQSNLLVKSIKQWRSSNIPEFIPKHPNIVFSKNGWISWGDFFGTNRIQDNKKSKIYLSYNDAKRWIYDNNIICTSINWKNINPINIPSRPQRYYKNKGWVNWCDFLSNDNLIQNQKKIFLSYKECVNWIKNNYEIKTHKDFKIKRKSFPNFIPTNPNIHFLKNNEWISWEKFFIDIN